MLRPTAPVATTVAVILVVSWVWLTGDATGPRVGVWGGPAAAVGQARPSASDAKSGAKPQANSQANAQANAQAKGTAAVSPEQADFFERRIRPLLIEHCHECHSAKKAMAGLRLDSPTRLAKGSDSGPVVVAGDPAASLLIQVVESTDPAMAMPPKGRLPAQATADLRDWVAQGAPWPAVITAPTDSAQPAPSRHWAWQPVRVGPPPDVRDTAWPANPIDNFVLAALESKGLRPNPPADRRTRMRRAYYTLWGLPPTAAEIAAFEADTAPDAWPRLVDRLLADPRYGQRWARHWLDVARYADTKGYVFQEERRYPFAYTYRDYVIDAFNSDKPYDRFILEQLAADQLVTPTAVSGQPAADTPPNTPRRGEVSLAAMGFLTLGRRFLNNTHDIIDDRIDVVTRGLMGLTVVCARCHDHKFDPIGITDYYSLYGVFASSREPDELPLLDTPYTLSADHPDRVAFEAGLVKRRAKVAEYRTRQREVLTDRFAREVASALRRVAKLPPAKPPETPTVGKAPDTANDKAPDKTKPPAKPVIKEAAPPELPAPLIERWQQYLAGPARDRHAAIWAPWTALSEALATDHKAQAPFVLAPLLANGGGSIHPMVAAILVDPPVRDLADLADRYGRLLADTQDHGIAQTKADKSRPAGKAPAPPSDPAVEILRQVLHGEDAPGRVPLEEVQHYFDRAQRNELRKLERDVQAWLATAPGSPPRAMVLVDADTPTQPRVFRRGNPNNRGEVVPRQFLSVLVEATGQTQRPFAHGSGRLEMARAIAAADNPLTARVWVNRVWMHHFGRALVPTVSDFGLRGQPPSHPELLDHLAHTLVASGWSTKALHRAILMSATFAQSSADNPAARQRDPENARLWRYRPQRLDFEALRDTLLAVAGTLDTRLGGPGVEITKAPFSTRRTVYAFIDRQNLPGLFRNFDFASPDTCTPQRFVTTVPQQGLFLLNSPFVAQQAAAVLAAPDVSPHLDDPPALVRAVFGRVLARQPDADELAWACQYLGSAAAGGGGHRRQLFAQVLLLSNELAFID